MFAFKFDRGNIYLRGNIYHCDSQWKDECVREHIYILRDMCSGAHVSRGSTYHCNSVLVEAILYLDAEWLIGFLALGRCGVGSGAW